MRAIGILRMAIVVIQDQAVQGKLQKRVDSQKWTSRIICHKILVVQHSLQVMRLEGPIQMK